MLVLLPGPFYKGHPASSGRQMSKGIRNWFRRRKFQQGKILSRFIACDIRRDILVVSTERLDDGFITCRIRTTNVLYLARGLAPPPEFEPAKELHIGEMWNWT